MQTFMLCWGVGDDCECYADVYVAVKAKDKEDLLNGLRHAFHAGILEHYVKYGTQGVANLQYSNFSVLFGGPEGAIIGGDYSGGATDWLSKDTVRQIIKHPELALALTEEDFVRGGLSIMTMDEWVEENHITLPEER